MKLDYSKTEACVKGSFTDENYITSRDNKLLSEDLLKRL